MKITSKEQYQKLESELLTEIQRYEKYYDMDGQISILHFVEHAELEMAFEILCLDLMLKHNVRPRGDEAKKLIQLGLGLGLDKESIYDPDFWLNFTQYLNEVSSTNS